MLARPTEEKHLPREIQPEPTPVFVRSHTRVKNEKPRKEGEGKLPDKWANYALVFDCETTTDIRQDLNFLCWPAGRACVCGRPRSSINRTDSQIREEPEG